MTYKEIMKDIQDSLSGDNEVDMQFLNEQIEKYKDHEQGQEILRACGRIMYSLIPEEAMEKIGKIINREKIKLESVIDEIHFAIYEKKIDKAVKLVTELANMADELHAYENDSVSEYFCFQSTMEELLYKIINEPTREIRPSQYPYAKVYLEQGSVYFEAGLYEEAERALEKARRWNPASIEKDFGKFIVDVFLDDGTKQRFSEVFDSDENPLDDIVSSSYMSLKILKALKTEKEYARLFEEELESLYQLMNEDFRAALSSRNDVIPEMEFLLSYYLFIYLSQIALRFDGDLEEKKSDEYVAYFKMAKESVAEDRDCVAQGWRKIERKTTKIFKHLIVLNMLNCHDNTSPYITYSQLYKIYDQEPTERAKMDEAIDFILNQYTSVYKHDTDIPGIDVDFSLIEYPCETDECIMFRKKVQYLYKCVSHQLDSKNYRQNVVSYVAGNYNHILKMRFVKSWGQLGHMMMISNEDLIYMIQICQATSDRMDKERGIQISDLFKEFDKRRLFFDGKTKQFIIDYLVDVNLIDSKCDSEEAQYVKRIQ